MCEWQSPGFAESVLLDVDADNASVGLGVLVAVFVGEAVDLDPLAVGDGLVDLVDPACSGGTGSGVGSAAPTCATLGAGVGVDDAGLVDELDHDLFLLSWSTLSCSHL